MLDMVWVIILNISIISFMCRLVRPPETNCSKVFSDKLVIYTSEQGNFFQSSLDSHSSNLQNIILIKEYKNKSTYYILSDLSTLGKISCHQFILLEMSITCYGLINAIIFPLSD